MTRLCILIHADSAALAFRQLYSFGAIRLVCVCVLLCVYFVEAMLYMGKQADLRVCGSSSRKTIHTLTRAKPNCVHDGRPTAIVHVSIYLLRSSENMKNE